MAKYPGLSPINGVYEGRADEFGKVFSGSAKQKHIKRNPKNCIKITRVNL
jgi:hypothetical protein